MGPTRLSPRGRANGARQLRSLLVLARPSPETDELLEPLLRRKDLCLLRVATLDAAEIALRDVAVSLVLVGPETEAESVTEVLDRADDGRRPARRRLTGGDKDALPARHAGSAR